jgi:hypothetical protein
MVKAFNMAAHVAKVRIQNYIRYTINCSRLRREPRKIFRIDLSLREAQSFSVHLPYPSLHRVTPFCDTWPEESVLGMALKKSAFKTNVQWNFQSWRWRQNIPSKRYFLPTSPHGFSNLNITPALSVYEIGKHFSETLGVLFSIKDFESQLWSFFRRPAANNLQIFIQGKNSFLEEVY